MITGSMKFGGSLLDYVRNPDYVNFVRRNGGSPPTSISPDNVDEKANPAYAFIDHDRLLATCPQCNGAEYVWIDQPYIWCAVCFNSELGGKLRPIQLPEHLAMIDRVLSFRDVANRNFIVGETLVDIISENLQHGIET